MQLTCRLSSLDYLLIRLPVLATSVRSRSAAQFHTEGADTLTAIVFCSHQPLFVQCTLPEQDLWAAKSPFVLFLSSLCLEGSEG